MHGRWREYCSISRQLAQNTLLFKLNSESISKFMHSLQAALFALALLSSFDVHAAARRFCENHLSPNYDSKAFAGYGLPRTPGAYLANLSGKRGFINQSRLAKDLKDIQTIRGQIATFTSEDTQFRMRAWLGQNSTAKKIDYIYSDSQIEELTEKLGHLLGRLRRVAPAEFQNSPWLNPENAFVKHDLHFASRYGEVFEAINEIIERTEPAIDQTTNRTPLLKSALAAMADIYFYSLARFSRETRRAGGEPSDGIPETITRFFMQSDWRPFEPTLVLRDLRTVSIHIKLRDWLNGAGLDDEQGLRLARTLALNRAREMEFEQSFKALIAKRGSRAFVDKSSHLVQVTLDAMPTLDVLIEDIKTLVVD